MRVTQILFSLIACLVFYSSAIADWTHFAPAQAIVEEPIELIFDDPSGEVAPLEAYLRLMVDGFELNPIPAFVLKSGEMRFSIPGDLMIGSELQYFVEITTSEGKFRFPQTGGWWINVAQPEEVRYLQLLSDLDQDNPDQVLLAFSVLSHDVDIESLEVKVNGEPLIGDLVVDPWLLTWQGKMPEGKNELTISMKDKSGEPMGVQTFDMSITGPDFVKSGFSATAWQEFNMDRLDGRTETWGRYHKAQLRFSGFRGEAKEAVRYRGRIFFSALDIEDDNLQPQSRIDAQISWKGLLLGVGDRHPNYGEAILSGTRVRGLELSTQGRIAGLKFVVGNVREARDPEYHVVAADSTFATDFRGSYRRQLMAFDLRAGKVNSGFEFGFSMAKTKDEVSSISLIATDTDLGLTDTLRSISPVDNLVAGLRVNLKAFRGQFVMRNQIATSMYNTNISHGTWDNEDVETLGLEGLPDPESLEDLIVINEYFSPLDLADGEYLPSSAIISTTNIHAGKHDFIADYRRIGTSFISLGSSFLTPDRQTFRLGDRFKMFKNQIYADVYWQAGSDNLDGQYDATVGTTSSNNIHIGLSAYPRARDLQLRLAFDIKNEDNEADSEDLASNKIDGTLNQVTLGASGGFNLLARQHRYSVTIINKNKSDNVSVDDSVTTYTERGFSTNQINFGLLTSLSSRTRLNMGLGFLKTDYDAESKAAYSYWNLRTALSRGWLSGKLESTLRFQYQQVSRDPENYGRLNTGAECAWQFIDNMRLSARMDWQTYTGDREDSWMQIVVRLSQDF
jgi:hypothetical protein